MRGVARAVLLMAAVALTFSRSLLAQDAVPTEIMSRTLFFRWSNEGGSIFTFDYHGKLYLVTARHVVRGVPAKGAVIQIQQQGEWKNYQTVRTLYPASPDVDIAVFETPEKTPPQRYVIQPMGSPGGVTFGQRVWFIGYPFGLGSIMKGGIRLPFMKEGSMSAIDSSNPNATVIYIDGFNNPGFSGGPIVFWDFTTHKYELLGVVMGYKMEETKAVINKQVVDTRVLENSGILVAYPIQYVTDTIKASLKHGH